MDDRGEKVIKELTNLPTTIYCGFYQLRITHDLRNKVIALLKEQEECCKQCAYKLYSAKEIEKNSNLNELWKPKD